MWLAPEIAKGVSDFTVATDIYSYGIILWELLTGRAPWDHLKPANEERIQKEAFYSKIRYELYEGNRPPVDRTADGKLVNFGCGRFPQAEAYVSLLKDCWADNPEDRPPSFEAIVYRLEGIKKEFLVRSSASSIGRGSAGSMARPTEKIKGMKEPERPPEGSPYTSSDQDRFHPDMNKDERASGGDLGKAVYDRLGKERIGDNIKDHSSKDRDDSVATTSQVHDEPRADTRPGTEERQLVDDQLGAEGPPNASQRPFGGQDTTANNTSGTVNKDLHRNVVIAPPLPTSPFDLLSNQQVVMGSSSAL